VASHMGEVLILDVRTRVETDEESARIAGAMLIPVNELRTRLGEVPDTKPVMTICRSGKRSVLAYNILRESGRKRVASIKGGLLRWYEEGLPVVQAAPNPG
jgi:sulfur dioxygenase